MTDYRDKLKQEIDARWVAFDNDDDESVIRHMYKLGAIRGLERALRIHDEQESAFDKLKREVEDEAKAQGKAQELEAIKEHLSNALDDPYAWTDHHTVCPLCHHCESRDCYSGSCKCSCHRPKTEVVEVSKEEYDRLVQCPGDGCKGCMGCAEESATKDERPEEKPEPCMCSLKEVMAGHAAECPERECPTCESPGWSPTGCSKCLGYRPKASCFNCGKGIWRNGEYTWLHDEGSIWCEPSKHVDPGEAVRPGDSAQPTTKDEIVKPKPYNVPVDCYCSITELKLGHALRCPHRGWDKGLV